MFPRFLTASVFSVGLSIAALTLPVAARPEIATGDQWLEGVNQDVCLSRVDAFIGELDVPFDEDDIERTGYFEDGVFRIFCYSGGPEASMLLVFAAHNTQPEVATQFMRFALQEIAQLETLADN